MKYKKYDIAQIQYILNKMKPLYKPFVPIEIKKGHYVIDIPARKTFIGLVNGKRNVLNFNFFTMAFGIESGNGSGSLLTVNGSNYCGAPNPSSPFDIAYGSGTQSPSFTQYSLQSFINDIYPPQITISLLSDRAQISVVGVLPGPKQLTEPVNEIGLYEWGGGNCGYFIMYGRIVSSFSPGSTVVYYVDVLEPWTYNYGYIIYSFISGSTPSGIVSTNGTTISTSWTEAKGASVLVGSANSYTASPSLYSISEDVVFSTSHQYKNNIQNVVDYILGTAVPNEEIQIQTLGLIQNYASGSSTYPVLILVLPLSSPITLYPNQENYVYLRLVAE